MPKRSQTNRSSKSKINVPLVADNQNRNQKTTTRRGRTIRSVNAPNVSNVTRLPSMYRHQGDVLSMRLKSCTNIVNNSDAHHAAILALTPGTISTAGYAGLGNIFPLLVGLRDQYAKFMITRLVVQMAATTPYTDGGYVAISFEPDDTGVSAPPGTLSDVMSSVHSDVAQVGETAQLALDVCTYFNDWKSCSSGGAAATTYQAGVVQTWSTNARPNSTGVAIMTIEVDIHFCGYRSLV